MTYTDEEAENILFEQRKTKISQYAQTLLYKRLWFSLFLFLFACSSFMYADMKSHNIKWEAKTWKCSQCGYDNYDGIDYCGLCGNSRY